MPEPVLFSATVPENMKRALFYHPQPLASQPVKGSEVRPVQMEKAFRAIGYHVDSVTGFSYERKKKMQKVRSLIQSGVTYDFAYVESWNVPIPLSDSHHLPLRPLQDYAFFSLLRQNQIPIGIYYRDIYWQAEDHAYGNAWWKRIPKRLFLWIEWAMFCRCMNHLFLPTWEIRSLLPTDWPPAQTSALPPGCQIHSSRQAKGTMKEGPIELFYVGGVTPPYYDLTPLFEIAADLDHVHLTICCREPEWAGQASYYQAIDLQDVKIVHASSDEIGRYYTSADMVADLRAPKGYLRTALPIKTVEAIGYEVPTIMRKGTSAATFVEQENTGWTVGSTEEAKQLLMHLCEHPDRIVAKREKVQAAQDNHTWRARARQAANTLEVSS